MRPQPRPSCFWDRHYQPKRTPSLPDMPTVTETQPTYRVGAIVKTAGATVN